MYVRTIHHAQFAPASFPSFRIIVSQVFIVSFRTYVRSHFLAQAVLAVAGALRSRGICVMGKASRESRNGKAPSYRPVAGGTHLAFHGGWSASSVQLPCFALGGRFFVQCDVARGSHFCRLVFGTLKPSKEDLSAVKIVKTLQHSVIAGGEDGDATDGGPLVSEELDPLADALCERDVACGGEPTHKSSSYYYKLRKKKATLRTGPPEATLVRLVVPRRPGGGFGPRRGRVPSPDSSTPRTRCMDRGRLRSLAHDVCGGGGCH